MGRLDTGEETGLGAGLALFVFGQVIEFATRERETFGALVFTENADTSADGFGGGFVVTSNDDDADTSLENKGESSTTYASRLESGKYLTAAHDRVEHFFTGGIQHANNADESHVSFVGGEFGRVRDVHIGNLGRVVDGGQSQATQSVAAGTVLASDFNDLVVDGSGHGHLLGTDAHVAAAVQDTLGSALAEHLGSVAEASALERNAVRGHGFPVAREFKGELLLPLGVHILADDDGGVAAVQAGLAQVVRVQLLAEGDERGLGGFTDLLEGLLVLVEIDGGVVAHHADGGHLVQGLVVAGADLPAVHGDLADGLVGGSRDLEFVEQRSTVLGKFVQDEHAANGHLVGGESTGLVGADDRGATKGFDGGQRADDGVLLGHAAGAESEASGDDSGQTFGNGSDGQGDGDLEIVDGSLDPRSTVGRVVEVSDVDGPDGNANDGDNLRELFTEFIEFLLERGLDLFGLGHFRADFADSGVQASADDNAASLAGSDVSTREQDVLLVLVDCSGIRNWFSVFDDGDGFTSKDGLINTDGGGQDLDDADISGDLVTNYSFRK